MQLLIYMKNTVDLTMNLCLLQCLLEQGILLVPAQLTSGLCKSNPAHRINTFRFLKASLGVNVS